jgi:hypothetical protein
MDFSSEGGWSCGGGGGGGVAMEAGVTSGALSGFTGDSREGLLGGGSCNKVSLCPFLFSTKSRSTAESISSSSSLISSSCRVFYIDGTLSVITGAVYR